MTPSPPLFLFSLVRYLAQHSEYRVSFESKAKVELLPPSPSVVEPPTNRLPSSSPLLSCMTCSGSDGSNVTGLQFSSLEEKRSHAISHWHKNNVARRVRHQAPLSFDEYERLMQPTCGFDSDSHSDTDSEQSMTFSLSSSSSEEERDTNQGDMQSKGSPVLDFSITFGSESMALYHCSIYKQVLLSSRCQGRSASFADYAAALQSCLSNPHPKNWCIVLCKGGDFAGAIFDSQTGQPIEHKTLHRYTSRRKQGGSQLVRDQKGGGVAHSAGSQLRRYNEIALLTDIRAVLVDKWSVPLSKCDHVFISASVYQKDFFASTSLATSCFLKDDERLRSIPFVTKKPSHAELLRIYWELTHLQPK